jgi:hypothetical protein
MSAPVELTKITKESGAVTKRIHLNPDGSIGKDSSRCAIGKGRMTRLHLPDWRDFKEMLEATPRNTAYALGALRPGLPDSIQLVRKRDPQSAQPGVATRTAAEILYRAEPSFVLCDFDTKGMPPDVESKLRGFGGFGGAIEAVCPAVATAGHIRRRSTSANLTNKTTGEAYQSHGEHLYLLVPRASCLRLPLLSAAISTPLILPTGRIIEKPGYDEGTGFFFNPLGAAFPPIPNKPTREDARVALNLLVGLIKEFPFVDNASKAVALSGILTSVARRALDFAFMHAVTAPAFGSGKSYLVDLFCMIATGRSAPAVDQSRNQEEFEKGLNAHLLKGVSHMAIDNVTRPLGGSRLAQILTQTLVDVRPFGTLDNITVGADRGKYVAAALTIIRAFMLTGGKQAEPINNYARYCAMIRDPLIWLGCADPCMTLETLREQDPTLEIRKQIARHWREVFGNEPKTARQVIDEASRRNDYDNELTHPDFFEALSEVAKDGKTLNPNKLGYWQRGVKNDVFSLTTPDPLNSSVARPVAHWFAGRAKNEVSCWELNWENAGLAVR